MKRISSLPAAGRIARTGLLFALVTSGLAAGCSYAPTDPDPIRIVTSPADVMACRRLGSVGATRTDGVRTFNVITSDGYPPPGVTAENGVGRPGWREPIGPDFGVRLDELEDRALRRGATTVLLRRKLRGDWSYAEAVAYRCRS